MEQCFFSGYYLEGFPGSVRAIGFQLLPEESEVVRPLKAPEERPAGCLAFPPGQHNVAVRGVRPVGDGQQTKGHHSNLITYNNSYAINLKKKSKQR